MAAINNAIKGSGTGQASPANTTLRAGDIKTSKEGGAVRGKIDNKLGSNNDGENSSNTTNDGDIAKDSDASGGESRVSQTKGKLKTTKIGELESPEKNKDKDPPRGDDNQATTDGLGINRDFLKDRKGTASLPPGAGASIPSLGGGGGGGPSGGIPSGGGGGISPPRASQPQKKEKFTDKAKEPEKVESLEDKLNSEQKEALDFSKKLDEKEATNKQNIDNFNSNKEYIDSKQDNPELKESINNFTQARDAMTDKLKATGNNHDDFIKSNEFKDYVEAYGDMKEKLVELGFKSTEVLLDNESTLEEKFESMTEARGTNLDLEVDIQDSVDDVNDSLDDINTEEEPEPIIEDEDIEVE